MKKLYFGIMILALLLNTGSLMANDTKIKTKQLMKKGVELSESGDIKGGIELFKQVLKLDPKNIKAYNNLGTSYFVLRDYNKSLYYQGKAIDLKPSDPRIYFYRALVLGKYMGKYKESIPDLTKAIELYPKYGRAILNRIIAYMATHEYQNALKDIETYIRLDKSNEASVIAYKVEAHYNLGKIKKAKQDLERAKKLAVKLTIISSLP